MLSQISWGSYFQFILCTVVIYYVAVIFIYYRGELKNRLKGKTITLPFTGGEPRDEVNGDVTFRSLLDEVNAYFDEAKFSRPSKEDVVRSLKRIVSKHPINKSSFYKVSLDNLIAMQSQNIGSLNLVEEDIEKVWEV